MEGQSVCGVEESTKLETTLLDLPLKHLMLRIAQHLTAKDLFALRRCSRYFRDLVDDVGIPALGFVDLSNSCYGVTHDFFSMHNRNTNRVKYRAAVAAKENIMKRCRNALLIKVNAKWLSDELLCDFLENNPSLEALELSSCSRISVKALQPLLKCKNLVVLKMTNMECGDDEFLRDLSQCNNHLLEVDFYGNEAMSPEVVKEFIAKQSHVKCIGLSQDTPEMTEGYVETIETIMEVCPNLESIQLYSLYDWSKIDQVLIKLATGCKMLKKIILGDKTCKAEDIWRENRKLMIFLAGKGIEFYLGACKYEPPQIMEE